MYMYCSPCDPLQDRDLHTFVCFSLSQSWPGMPSPVVSMQLCAHLELKLQGNRLLASRFPQHLVRPKGRREGPPGARGPRACPGHLGRAQRLRQSLLLLVFQFASARKLARCVPDRSARGPFISPAAAARAGRAHKALKRRPLPFSRKLAFLVPPARCTAAVTRTPKQRSQYSQALGVLPGGSQ